MKHLRAYLILSAVVAVSGCQQQLLTDEGDGPVGATVHAAKKGQGGVNGDSNFCNNPAATCDTGEGDCDRDDQCTGALVCGVNNGIQWGFAPQLDVCVPAHCENDVLDSGLGETEVDCGGPCGFDCTAECAPLPPSPAAGACSDNCPCDAGESDCNNDSNCATGLVCAANIGDQFGYSTGFDVCVPPHCTNGILDADETAIDCGGADCGSDCGEVCAGLPANGQPGHCVDACPCPPTEGECVGDTSCQGTAVCVADIGASFGFGATIDVCLADHCQNLVQDGDEDGVDCGPSCEPCEGLAASVNSYGGTSADFAISTASDTSGNLIVAGRFRETANFGGSDLTAPGAATTWDIWVAKYSPSGAHIWSRNIGGTGSEGNRGVALDVDDTGAVALAGSFNGTVDFGTGPITGNSASVADAFVMVLEPNDGSTRWVQTFGGTGPDGSRAVTFDGTQVIVAGSFSDTANFGGGGLTSSGQEDVFVASYSAALGTHSASNAFGGPQNDIAYGVAADDGTIFIVGAFRQTATFGSQMGTSNGADDAFIVRLSSSLVPVSSRFYGGSSVDRAFDVDVDFSGNPRVAGMFSNTVDFGISMETSAGGRDAFVHALTRGLADSWLSVFGGTGTDYAQGIAVDPTTRDVGVTGVVNDTVANFPGGSSSGLGGADAFLVIYSRLGAVQNTARNGGTGDDTGYSVDLRSGFSAVVGGFEGSATFDGTGLTSLGSLDAFVTRQPQ